MTLIPVQITLRNLSRSAAIEADIQERVAWLEQFYGTVIGCRVLVAVPHRHRQGGRRVHVRIEVTVPNGAPIVVSYEPSLHGTLKDIEEPAHRKQTEIEGEHRYPRVAVHRAFDAARRRLQDFAREQRGAVKSHESSGL